MLEQELQSLDLASPNGNPNGSRRIAYRLNGARVDAPVRILWLSGYLSDMQSTKATALAAFAAERDLPMMRFDYSGHGRSGGDIKQGSIGAWLDETLAIWEIIATGPCIVVGSSMGGWLALLLARHLVKSGGAENLAGLVLIAPAWDMTEALMWRQLPESARQAIQHEGVFLQPSNYDSPYPITRTLIEEGRSHLLEGSKLDPGCPVRILQGMQDPDVPWRHALALTALLANEDVELDLIKDGDHRLSRPQDIRRLERTVAALIEDRLGEAG